MGDIIPEIGQCVMCRDLDLGLGKVVQVNHGKGEFTARFIRDPEDGPEEKTLPLCEIEGIVDDLLEIESFEKELEQYDSHW